MNAKLFLMMSIAAVGVFSSHAAGFALYGASAKGMALGGTVMGKAVDASANFYNPATLDDLKETTISLGTGIEIPSCDVRVSDSRGHSYQGRMNPGVFLLPHAYVSQPLPWGFTFGLGMAPEYGLGSEYDDNWPMSWNSVETTIEGFVVNPNLTYAVTEDWSVSAGFRILYMTFEQESRPNVAISNSPFGLPGYSHLGQFRNHIKADNGFSDWGWTISTRYKILDNLQVGVMYRSYIDAQLRGDCNTQVGTAQPPAFLSGLPAPYAAAYSAAVRQQLAQQAAAHTGRGGADIRLPQSIIAGINWDATETIHLGYTMTWTRWSELDQINFDLPGGGKHVKLNWRDVFRFGVGGAWDFAENWTLMGSYVYDIDPCSTERNVGTTMLPSGDRHIIAGGLAWHWRGLEIAASYGIIMMSSREQAYSDPSDPTVGEYRFDTRHGLSHQIGATISYSF